ncbi:MAG TPA: hypothetical protein VMT69_16935 [Kineosporiaceae bacterium]|nr:hypothetical protein [Kineosporiaceae bacterium]
MRVLVVHESLFGHTRAVARAVAAGVASARPDAEVECLSVRDVPPDAAGADLLVVGGPTHFWGPTSVLSRAMEDQYERRIRPRLHPTGCTGRRREDGTGGVRAWLADLPAGRGAPTAAFDTRIDRPFTGGAAAGIARRLRRRGYRLVAPPEAFVVEHVAGPLRAGEQVRARAWGAALAAVVGPSAELAPAGPITASGRIDDGVIKESVPRTRQEGWESSMSTAPAVADIAVESGGDGRLAAHHATSGARSTWAPATGDGPRGRPAVDLTRLLTTAELVVGAVLVARVLARRPATAHAQVTMGPGSWVSMKGGTVAVRPARRPFGRPRSVPQTAVDGKVPVWARVLSAVPLQRLVG